MPLALSDAPRYPYRGLLIDSARHFISIVKIKRMIDGMSTMKLNVLHCKPHDHCRVVVRSSPDSSALTVWCGQGI